MHLPFFRHDGQAPEFEGLTRRGPPYIQIGPERKGVLHPGGGTPEPGLSPLNVDAPPRSFREIRVEKGSGGERSEPTPKGFREYRKHEREAFGTGRRGQV